MDADSKAKVLTEEGSRDYRVPPVMRAFHLLRFIGSGQDCSNVQQAAQALGINRTTLIRLLQTLLAERAIARTTDGRGYRLGPGLVSLAAQALEQQDLVEVARPVLLRLSGELGLSAYLGIRDGDCSLYLARQTPQRSLVSNIRVGSRVPLPATSIGRVLLAGMSDDAIRELLPEKQLADLSQGQFEQHAELLKSLQQDRREGLSWSIGCYEAGVGSCAVPVPDRRGHAVAAINVVGPQPAFESAAGRARIGEHLRRAAAEIAAPSGMARD